MIIDSVLHLSTDELSERQWRRLFNDLSYIGDDGNLYEPWQVLPHKKTVRIPRGAWALLPDSVEYHDWRVFPENRILDFTATLDSEGFSGQIDAVNMMLGQEQGIVVAQPGWGKTNVALAFAAVAMTKTLVLVHTEDILQQWITRASEITDAKVGVIRGKQFEIGDITISTVQTFGRAIQRRPKLAKAFGAVILDEAHHAPANSFDLILNSLEAKYRFGFTATDKRADGRHPYMTTVLGPVIYRSKFNAKIPVEVRPLKSGMTYRWRGSWDWRNLLNALIVDEKRNALIAEHVVRQIKKGETTLVLSREIKHLEQIQDHIRLKLGFDEGWTQQVEILAAKTKTKTQRAELLQRFVSGDLLCILATQLADEALDVPRLSRIFLTFPGKHDGRIIQQIGRALREHPEKENAIIFDVVDDRIGVLRRQWMKRKQAYKSLKIPVKKRRMKT